MRIEKVEKDYAARYQQTKRFGVISEGCIGVWGEGRTLDAAISDAKRNQKEFAGSVSMDGCWAMEIETRGAKSIPSADKLVTVTLRILPAEIEAIKVRAFAEGIAEGEWKRRAIRAALQPPARSP
jgi:hypothetical protein